MLGDEELLKPPYSIENQAHRRAVLAELDRVKALGVKPPQNLWEYKVRVFEVCTFFFYYALFKIQLNVLFLSLSLSSRRLMLGSLCSCCTP